MWSLTSSGFRMAPHPPPRVTSPWCGPRSRPINFALRGGMWGMSSVKAQNRCYVVLSWLPLLSGLWARPSEVKWSFAREANQEKIPPPLGQKGRVQGQDGRGGVIPEACAVSRNFKTRENLTYVSFMDGETEGQRDSDILEVMQSISLWRLGIGEGTGLALTVILLKFCTLGTLLASPWCWPWTLHRADQRIPATLKVLPERSYPQKVPCFPPDDPALTGPEMSPC